MLHQFITDNRDELIGRCREKAAKRFEPSAGAPRVERGVALFLQHLVETLRFEQLAPGHGMHEPQAAPAPTDIGRAAAMHGAEMLSRGYSVDQVVHDYGDVCQAVTELAIERDAPIGTGEFRTLNRSLDNAIADAVTAFGHAREDKLDALHERLRSFADEQRQLVDIAVQSYSAIKTGNIGLAGATGALLVHALGELRSLADRIQPPPQGT